MDAALAGLPADFPFGGTVYKVLPRTFEVELNFQVWLEGQAYEALLRHRARLGEAEFAARSADWVRDCAAGAYEWGTRPAWLRLLTRSGQERLAWLKINAAAGAPHNGPRVSEEAVHAMAGDPAAWGRLMALVEAQDFPEARAPNGQAPAAPPAPPAAPSA